MLLHPKSLLNLPRANLAGLSDNLHIDIEIRSRSALDNSAGPESCVKSGVPHCVNCFGPRPADGFPLEALPTVSLLKPSLRLETRAQPTSAASASHGDLALTPSGVCGSSISKAFSVSATEP